MARRGKKKQFWLTDEQAADLADKARRACMTEVDYIRLILRDFVPPEKPEPEFYQAMNQVSAFARTLSSLSEMTSDADIAALLESESKEWKNFRLDMERRFLKPERRNT